MSQAFVREREEQWLHEVQPTLTALQVYLTRENNGIRVYEQRTDTQSQYGTVLHCMSNGIAYTKDADGRWMTA